MRRVATAIALLLLAASLAGCDYYALKKAAAAQEQEVTDLRALNGTLTQQLTNSRADVVRLEAELERRGLRPRPIPAPQPAKATPLEPKRAALARTLAGSAATVAVRRNRIVVTAPVGYESGKDVLTASGRAVLRRVGAAVKSQCADWEVGVAGHSDSARIAKPATRRRFPTNWHLSGFRALAAMDYLNKHCGVKAAQLHFRGYGQYHPTASNATAAGRARNRRIEIILAPPR